MNANERKRSAVLLLPVIAALLASPAYTQEMTERHIPVGAYPSLKSEYLTAGTITAVDGAAGTLTLETNVGERNFSLTARTKIWLDRSGFGQPTQDGGISDLTTGLEAEVRALGPERANVAYWVKVRVTPP